MWTRGLTADQILGIYAAGYNHQPLTAASSTGVKPIITAPPVSQALTEGDDFTFTVVAMGTAPLGYQWRKGGVPISGATNASLLSTVRFCPTRRTTPLWSPTSWECHQHAARDAYGQRSLVAADD